ncbi:hypothetical protein SAMD00023353_3201200 [Rosellinia necatrix]|uniref:Uncharacterized protein n=1 Tax=Rosellinia necatrix TaxID=77044 RepID=A0A1W2TIQ5_ROSNE|nr:hypothetical protein SAMD00023353_3201200 [Rosellinia necatrix]
MPYKLHHWDDGSDASDPGWPRRYLTHDIHTACKACHKPNGFLRILHHLFGGPVVRCRHHRGRADTRDPVSQNGWTGGVRGITRHKGCHFRDHYALAFRKRVDVAALPDRVAGGWLRTRLPAGCRERTPRGQVPSHTVRYPDHTVRYAEHVHAEHPSAYPYPYPYPYPHPHYYPDYDYGYGYGYGYPTNAHAACGGGEDPAAFGFEQAPAAANGWDGAAWWYMNGGGAWGPKGWEETPKEAKTKTKTKKRRRDGERRGGHREDEDEKLRRRRRRHPCRVRWCACGCAGDGDGDGGAGCHPRARDVEYVRTLWGAARAGDPGPSPPGGRTGPEAGGGGGGGNGDGGGEQEAQNLQGAAVVDAGGERPTAVQGSAEQVD